MSILDTPAKGVAGARDFLRNQLGLKQVGTVFPKQDFPEGFVIQEYVQGKPAEKIVLIGNMLPMIPFEYGGEQNIVKTYYAGNSEPSNHIMGPREDNIIIKGRLKDKKYDDVTLKNVAYEVSKQVEAFRLRGNLVEMRLGEWRRFGFIERARFEMKDLRDIRYQIEFSVIGFNPPLRTYIIRDTKEIPFAINKQLIEQATAFQNDYSVLPDAFQPSIADSIRGIVSDIATVVNSVTSFIDGTLSQVEDVASSLTRARGLVNYGIGKISEYRRRLGNIALSAENLGIDVPARYTSAAFIYGIASDSHGLTNSLVQLRERFASLADTTPQARYRVVEGDTLQTIASKFYNDASLWENIYKHNNLSTTLLVSGTVLEIPRL
jgi:hypothetical protein